MDNGKLAVIRSPHGRRVVGEFLRIGGALAAVLLLVVEPFLLSRVPSVFQEPSSPRRVAPPVRMLPATRVGWVNGLLDALVLGSFLYYRLYHTALGAELEGSFEKSE